jgi:hypothetical protein
MAMSNFGLAYVSKDSYQSGASTFHRHCFALTKAAMRGVDAKPCDPAASPCCAASDNVGPQGLAAIAIQTSEHTAECVRGLPLTCDG